MLTGIASSSGHLTLYAAELMLVGEGCQEKVRSETLSLSVPTWVKRVPSVRRGPGRQSSLPPPRRSPSRRRALVSDPGRMTFSPSQVSVSRGPARQEMARAQAAQPEVERRRGNQKRRSRTAKPRCPFNPLNFLDSRPHQPHIGYAADGPALCLCLLAAIDIHHNSRLLSGPRILSIKMGGRLGGAR